MESLNLLRIKTQNLKTPMRKWAYLFFGVLIVACSQQVESNSEASDSDSQHLKPKKNSNQKTSSQITELNYSDFLGHYYEYAGSVDSTFSSLLSKYYFDVRFGSNSLVVMKCTKIAECGDKIALKFKKRDDNQVIFELASSNSDSLPTWSFKGDYLTFSSLDHSTKEWKESVYLAYREELGESAY